MKQIKDLGNSYQIGNVHIDKKKLETLKKLTIEDFESITNLGIIISGISDKEIYFNYNNISFCCPLKIEIKDILKYFKEKTDLIAIELGKQMKIQEIKSVLDIYEE